MLWSLLLVKYVVPKTGGLIWRVGSYLGAQHGIVFSGILGCTEILNIKNEAEFRIGNYFEVGNYFGVATYLGWGVIYIYCCYLIRLQCGMKFTANQIRSFENRGSYFGGRDSFVTWFMLVSVCKFCLYFRTLHRN